MMIIIMISVLNMPTYKQSVNATDEWLVYAGRHLASTSTLSNAMAFLFMSRHLQYLLVL